MRSPVHDLQRRPQAKLSARELEVLRLVARGDSNKQIARTLFRSGSTVAMHLRNIFARIAVENRTEAAAFAFRNRLPRRLSVLSGGGRDGFEPRRCQATLVWRRSVFGRTRVRDPA
jgi:DNA-binding CsgD family transcriptional regulator